MENLEIFRKFAKNKRQITERKEKKAVIYTRVSTKEQMENNASLETQKKYCEAYASKKGYEVVEYFGGTYESAKSDERKEFQKMLTFVKRRKDISSIIVYSYDRFSRTGANGAYISNELKKKGITTQSATQEVDAKSSAGTFQQNLYYMFSQFDNELRRDKTVSGMQEKLRKGYCIGPVPFGYTNLNPGKGKEQKLVINEKGKLLRKAFLWKANRNMPHRDIIERLAKKGLKIDERRLSEYFRRPFYCGLLVNNMLPDEIIPGKHEPLISKETFLKIHNLLLHRESGNKYSEDDINLPLKCFVKSAVCETPYTGYVVKKKGLYYYKNRRKGSNENRSAKIMHNKFIELLGNYQLNGDLLTPAKEIAKFVFVQKHQERLQEIKEQEAEIKLKEKQLERMKKRYVVLEDISKEDYYNFKSELENDIAKIQADLFEEGLNSSNLEKAVDLALNFSCNIVNVWKLQDIELKKLVQNLVFPEGILFDFKNDEFRTPRVNEFFKIIPSISDTLSRKKNRSNQMKFDNSDLVTQGGFEPPTLRAEI
ncbi:recombinase family protein [Aquimarina algicola]|uniref:Recombinase family protein n=1 Tax=Aquimarina algicola TaxID=2589995 RepID=A0A504JIJ5_9FLAO|nr:recombinase family protein [Aquimarina algicola]TPN86330.1 recombinase family protein [Aquimarina algicola]